MRFITCLVLFRWCSYQTLNFSASLDWRQYRQHPGSGVNCLSPWPLPTITNPTHANSISQHPDIAQAPEGTQFSVPLSPIPNLEKLHHIHRVTRPVRELRKSFTRLGGVTPSACPTPSRYSHGAVADVGSCSKCRRGQPLGHTNGLMVPAGTDCLIIYP